MMTDADSASRPVQPLPRSPALRHAACSQATPREAASCGARHPRRRRPLTALWLAAVLCVWGGAAHAQQADAAALDPQAVLQGMRSALFNSKAQTGRMLITVRNEDGTQTEWRADYLQQRRADGGYTLIAMRAPEEVAGVALLTKSAANDSRTWMYVPSVRRTRELDAMESDTRFLFSDITYGDLGMLERRATDIRVSLPTPAQDATNAPDAYVIERVPADSWQVSRIKTWLSQKDRLPLRREFYDRAGRLWKVATFTHREIGGIPTIVGLTMRDMQGGGETSVQRTDITYIDKVDDALFAPDELWRSGQRELIQASDATDASSS